MFRCNENRKHRRFSHPSAGIVPDFGCPVKSDAGRKSKRINPFAARLSKYPSAGGSIICFRAVETPFWHLRCPQIGALNRLCGKRFKWLSQGEQYDFPLRAENDFDLRTASQLTVQSSLLPCHHLLYEGLFISKCVFCRTRKCKARVQPPWTAVQLCLLSRSDC